MYFQWSLEKQTPDLGQEGAVCKLQGCSIKLMSKVLTILMYSIPEKARTARQSESHYMLSTELMKVAIS